MPPTTRVIGNWVYDNADRGIQLFPDADGTRVAGNVVDGNGQGVMVAGDKTATSDRNLIEQNLITNSMLRDNVESNWASLGSVGSQNLVRENCVAGGVRDDGDGGIADLRPGLVVDRNLVRGPALPLPQRQRLPHERQESLPGDLRPRAGGHLRQDRRHVGLGRRSRHRREPLPHGRTAGRLAQARPDGLPAGRNLRRERPHRPGRASRRAGHADEPPRASVPRSGGASTSPTTRTS